MGRKKIKVERIRITRVGVWFLIILMVITIAAFNSGNNALLLVVAALMALLVVSGFASRRNLRGVELAVGLPGEVFAGRPFSLPVRLTNRDRWMARRFLVLEGLTEADRLIVPHIRCRKTKRERLYFRIERRGLHRFSRIRLLSVFPLGLFQKAMLYPIDVEILVYPRLLTAASDAVFELGRLGEEPSVKIGPGHELHALRHFRLGDDPRGIHWKRTARTGEMVFMEREKEEARRLSIVLDNAVGELSDPRRAERFEHLVSEAATAATQFLADGYEVSLVTRDEQLPFSRGEAHRRHLLEVLALVEARPLAATPLRGMGRRAPEIRLSWGASEERRAV